MRKEECFYLGKIVSKHSYKGEVHIKLDTDQPHLYENLESVFVAIGNSLIPFFITQARLHKTSLLRVKFEEVNDEEGADEIMGSEIYLPLDQLPELTGNQFYYHEIIGFKVLDLKHGEIGQVKSIIDTAAQAILELDHNGDQILIPINKDIIIKLDRNKKEVHVNTPEGLVELYISKSEDEE